MKKILLLSLISITLLLTSCHSIIDKSLGAAGLQQISQTNAQIAQIEKQKDDQISDLEKQKDDQKLTITTVYVNQEQSASNNLFESQVAFMLKYNLDDLDKIAQNGVEKAQTTLPSPDAPTINSTMDKVKQELADKENLNNKLADQLTAAQTNATKLNNDKVTAEKKIIDLTSQEQAVVNTTNGKINDLNSQLKDKVGNILQQQDQLLSNKDAWDKMKKTITFVCGGLALLFLAASIYSPILKGQSIAFAGILAGIAIGIQFLQPWMVGVTAIIGLAILLLYIHYQHHTTTTALNNATGSGAPVVLPPTPITASISTTSVIPPVATAATSTITTTTK